MVNRNRSHTENVQDERRGLDFWMRQVPDLVERCVESLSEKNVHDLRVTLRRCRTMAQSLRRIDRDSAWRKMNAEAKKLFSALGALRDAQVLPLLIDDIAPKSDAAAEALKALLREREADQSALAIDVLRKFNLKSWNFWSVILPPRAARWELDGPIFEHMALQYFLEAKMLHRMAVRNRSTASYHLLRIGLKRFRYSVEYFLPSRHKKWGGNLRVLQDALGEFHDLDVLRKLLPQAGPAYDAVSKRKWNVVLRRESSRRIQRYRKLMIGPKSLWNLWQSGFPLEKDFRRLGSVWLREFAGVQSEQGELPRRIEDFTLRIFDALHRTEESGVRNLDETRQLLAAVAQLCAIDPQKPKRSASVVEQITPPLGWTKEEMDFIAAVVRQHRKGLKAYAPIDRHDWPEDLARLLPLFVGIIGIATLLADLPEASPDRLILTEKKIESFEIALNAGLLNPDAAADLALRRAVLEKLLKRPFFVRDD